MRVAVGDVSYSVRVEGPERGRPLLLLHGFTGSSATWSTHFASPSAARRAIAVDLLGHGETDAPQGPERYRMERSVRDLVDLLDQCDVERVDVLGYSMGGRVALHLAAAHPERIGALVLESASPGIREADEREARRRRDDELADFIERHGIESFVDRWERLPIFATQDKLPADVRAALRRQRLQNRPLGLANSLRGMGTGVQRPLHDRLSSISVPALLIAGALDEKFVKIAREMAEALPAATLSVVPAAGHAVHLERPRQFERLVSDFLTEREEGPVS